MSEPASKPSPAVTRLQPFVGRWDTSGTVLDESGAPAGELSAVDTYEWFPGGFFLLHHVDGRLGGKPIKALEIIGAGRSGDKCLAHSFDNAGQADEFEVALTGRKWSIEGMTQRFRGELSRDFHTLEGRWDISDDGANWRPWMQIRLVKR